MVRKKYGNQLPTQSVILPFVKKRSLSKEAIELYEKTGLSSYIWQKKLLEAMMAVEKRTMGPSEVRIFHSTTERKIRTSLYA